MAGMNELTKSILERYGFAALACVGLAYFIRQDLVLPLIESHPDTLRGICETHKEISHAIQEQTRLLYRLQPNATAGNPPPFDEQN